MKLHRALWLLLMVLLLAGCGTASATYGVSVLDDADEHYDPYDYEEYYDASDDYILKEDAVDYVWENCREEIIDLVRDYYSAEELFEEEVCEITEESYSWGYNDASDGEASVFVSVTDEGLDALPEAGNKAEETVSYIANTSSYKFHYPYCNSVNAMKEKNKLYWTGTRDELVEMGYVPCKNCNP